MCVWRERARGGGKGEEEEAEALDGGHPALDEKVERKGIQIPMSPGRSTEIISIIGWIRTSRLSIKDSPSVRERMSQCVCGERE